MADLFKKLVRFTPEMVADLHAYQVAEGHLNLCDAIRSLLRKSLREWQEQQLNYRTDLLLIEQHEKAIAS